MSHNEDNLFGETLKNLPQIPGIYKFFDEQAKIIYIGKAKNLKNRVSSYFIKSNNANMKTKRLIREIRAIEYTVVDTEFDALLLENNLIKEYQPKYNILLKDDKTYPYICVTKEPFPRVFPIRNIDIKKGKYFGPYGSVKVMYTLLELIRKLYTIRTCKLPLSIPSIEQNKFKICLEYHIKNCKGPCEAFQSQEDYNHDIEQVVNILKGKLNIAQHYFKQKMQEAAERLAFEEAQAYKEKLNTLDSFQSKSLVANPNITDIDVFTIFSDEKCAYINYLHIDSGCIIHTQTTGVKKKLDEIDADILAHFIVEFRQKFNSTSPKIITNLPLEIEFKGAEVFLPKIGDLKKLVELSYKNIFYFRKEKMDKAREGKQDTYNRVLEKLKHDLNLQKLPYHIECFDNSNSQGTNPVSAMVCFKNGKPSKKDYRHYNIKTVEGPDDFASMYEVVYRRYKRLKEENTPLPDLIVIDGGKGQLSIACQALKDLELYGAMPIISIAKRLEEIYYPEDELPIHIHKKSESLILLQQVRDEAHRFAITFHRNKRSANSLESSLEKIEGIGKNTVERLLKKYKSINKLKEIPETELITLIGKHKTLLLKKALASNK